MKKVVIEIDLDTGEQTVSGEGFVGAECAQATAPVIEALGVKTSEQKLPEFYRVATATKKNTVTAKN